MEQHAHRRQQHREQHLQQHRQQQTQRAAVALRPFEPDQHHAQQLRQEQQHQRRGEQSYRQFRSPLRPHREKLARLQEVLRLHQGMHHLQRRRKRQEHKPERRREIGHHAGQKYRTVHRVHPFHQEQAEVHQVAVTPAAVALQLVQQVRRQLLIGARQIVRDPDAPAGAAHQRGFDKVVRQNRTGERPFARQRRQRAVLNKRLHADNGVVAPVVRFAQLPEVQTGGKQRPVNAGGELLTTRIERIHARRLRRRLDNAGVRVRFHHAHQTGQTLAAHYAVRIQHHHIAVLAAPATAEVVNVAAFTFHAAAAAAIEDLAGAAHVAHQLHPRLLLRHGDVGVVAVAEDIDVKMLALAAAHDGFPGSAQTGEDALHIFVADRHDQRRAVRRIDRLIAVQRIRDAVFIAPDHQLQEAHQRRPEASGDPAEQNSEQEQDAGLQHIRQQLQQRLLPVLVQHVHRVDQRPALVRQNGLHIPGGDHRLEQGKDQKNVATNGADVTPFIFLSLLFRRGIARR